MLKWKNRNTKYKISVFAIFGVLGEQKSLTSKIPEILPTD